MTSSRQSLGSRKPTLALLSIRPEFADAIAQGVKRFEFRRYAFAREVTVVLVYATSPVGLVVGEFDVRSVIRAPLPELWRRTKHAAGIDETVFLRYFAGRDAGAAIEVGQFRAYAVPYSPLEVLGTRPPRSFRYLDSENTEHCRSTSPVAAFGPPRG